MAKQKENKNKKILPSTQIGWMDELESPPTTPTRNTVFGQLDLALSNYTNQQLYPMTDCHLSKTWFTH